MLIVCFHSNQKPIIHTHISSLTRLHFNHYQLNYSSVSMRMAEASESTAHHNAATQFDQSLEELRGLSPQLQFAAEYCKTAFFNSQDKNKVLETTKEYITRAVVTVVDHLGSISANLEHSITHTNSEEAHRRIDNLAQRIGTCQLHTHNLGLRQLKWNPRLPRYHSRYVSSSSGDSATMSAAKSKEANRAEAKDHHDHDSKFHFQLEKRPWNVKHSTIKWKSIKQKKRDVVGTFIIKRGKQIVT